MPAKKRGGQSKAAAKRAAQVRSHRTSADPLTRLQASQARIEQRARAKLRKGRVSGDWVSISSTRVHRAQFNPKTSTLNVVFSDGTPWHYTGVTDTQYRRLLEHEHPGSYINTLTQHADAHGYGHI